jgi:hypothetical protein
MINGCIIRCIYKNINLIDLVDRHASDSFEMKI